MKDAQTVFRTLSAYSPVFSSYGGALYESELVRAAIDAKARHISKLQIEVTGAAQPKLQTKIKHQPNSWMTWSQFLYRLATILEVHNTAFIIPVKDIYDETVGFFPALPTKCAMLQGKDGEEFLKYTFRTNQVGILPRKECGILTKYQYSSDFFGENNNALAPTMDLVEVQNKGIEEAVRNSNTFRFMAQMTNFSKPEDLANEQSRFSEKILKGEGGMLLFPNTYGNIKQIESHPYTVEPEQAKLINTNVFNYSGVNDKVLQNTANGDELDAFFNGAIEPLAIQLSEAMTAMVFTQREQSEGARIIATANRLQYMSTSAKVAMAQQLGDRGMITINEVRELFNYAPLPQGEGSTIRGEYYILNEDGTITKKEGNEDAS